MVMGIMTHEAKSILKKIDSLILNFGAAQLALVLATPLLTRLYSPAVFADFGYVASCVAIFLPLVTLQYEFTFPTTKTKRIIPLLLTLCMYVIICTSVILLIIFLLIQYFWKVAHLSLFIILFGFIILLIQAVLQVYLMLLVSEGKIEKVAYGKLI